MTSTRSDDGPRRRGDDPRFPHFEQAHFRTDAWGLGKAKSPDDIQPYHPTLVRALAEAARLEPETGVTVWPERPGRPIESASYRELYQRARRAARGLRALGVRRGDRVLLVLPTSLDFVAGYFGAELLGAVPVPTYPPSGLRLDAGLRRLAHIAVDCGARVCVTWPKARLLLGDLGLRAPQVASVVTVDDLRREPALGERDEPAPGDRAMLQYTSGSTGRPKGVALTHDNVVTNVHSIGQALEINRRDVVVSWCPLYHDMGLIGALLFSIYWRIPLVLLSPMAFLHRPRRWLEAITAHRGTLSPAPNFGYAFATKRVPPAAREGLDLSSWRVALNGAEPVDLSTVRDFCAAYEPHGFDPDAMWPVYGLAEASLAVAFPDPGTGIRFERVDRAYLARGHAIPSPEPTDPTFVSVGQAVPGQHVAVVGEDGEPLPERRVGYVLAGGRSIMEGYFEKPDATRAVVRDGWLWTGDLGYVSGGHLYVTGRAKDVVVVRGRNYHAEDLESTAERVEGVRAGGCVAFGRYDEGEARDRVVLVCETRLSEDADRRELERRVFEAVQTECGLSVDEVVLVPPRTIPKTSSGKRQRWRCRELYLRNELEPPRRDELRKAILRSAAGHAMMRVRGLIGARSDD